MCVYIFLPMYACMYVCTYVCMYVCMYMQYVPRYVCMHACVYVLMSVHSRHSADTGICVVRIERRKNGISLYTDLRPPQVTICFQKIRAAMWPGCSQVGSLMPRIACPAESPTIRSTSLSGLYLRFGCWSMGLMTFAAREAQTPKP